MIIRFPGQLLPEQSLSWQLTRRTTNPPGQTGAGFVPAAETTGGGLWRAELTDIPIRTRAQVMTWRALEALLDGGAAQIVVPLCDKRYFPAPIINGVKVISYDPVPHDDGALFDDGAGYHQPVVSAYVADDAALRATEITVAMVSGATPQAGQMFSIAHPNMRERLYVIHRAAIDSDGNSTLKIRPPLREAVGALTDVEFDHPCCVMQLATPESFKLALDLRKFGKPSAVFVESFDPEMLNGTRQATLPGTAASGIGASPATDNELNFANPINSQYLPVVL